MTMSTPSRFTIHWVLVDALAIGPAPRHPRHLSRLQEAGIQAVLSLCGPEEAPPPEGMQQSFHCERVVLPDHRSGHPPERHDLQQALNRLAQLHHHHGAVFVHCVAAMERSPLVCMAWLMQQHRLSTEQALDYLMDVHPGTNPLPDQLRLLQEMG